MESFVCAKCGATVTVDATNTKLLIQAAGGESGGLFWQGECPSCGTEYKVRVSPDADLGAASQP